MDYIRKLFHRFKRSLLLDPNSTYRIFESRAGSGKTGYVAKLQMNFPTLLHEVYRYAISVLGATAHSKAIVDIMNRRSKVQHPNCPIRSNLNLNTYHFWLFFHKNNGKLKQYRTKPRITPQQKEDRVKWAKALLKEMEELGDNFIICFIDEKWFYTTSRRKKMKILPKAPFETESEAHVPIPKQRSRKHALKIMEQGVVGIPVPKHGFNGLIYLGRIMNTHETTRNSFNQHISSMYEVNHALKAGDWKELFLPIDLHSDVTVETAVDYIKATYELEDEVSNELHFSYKTFTKRCKKAKWERLHEGFLLKDRVIMGEDRIERKLTLDDITLHKRIEKGSIVCRDCSCDSKYMISVSYDIAAAIRKSYHWVKREIPIKLVIDNAGGHGTKAAKLEFEVILRYYNIIVHWQIPNSPESNMLDLGVWMSVQSVVEQIHRTLVMQHDILDSSIKEAFWGMEYISLLNIYNRWKRVLELIVQGEGSNQLVETCRRKDDRVEYQVYVDEKEALIKHFEADGDNGDSESEYEDSEMEDHDSLDDADFVDSVW